MKKWDKKLPSSSSQSLKNISTNYNTNLFLTVLSSALKKEKKKSPRVIIVWKFLRPKFNLKTNCTIQVEVLNPVCLCCLSLTWRPISMDIIL